METMLLIVTFAFTSGRKWKGRKNMYSIENFKHRKAINL